MHMLFFKLTDKEKLCICDSTVHVEIFQCLSYFESLLQVIFILSKTSYMEALYIEG